MPCVSRLSGYACEPSAALSANVAAAAMGVVLIYYQASQPIDPNPDAFTLNFPYFAISLSLNILLTLMIIIRLVLLGRDIRNPTGTRATTTGLCKAVVTMLVESFAFYAVNFLLFIVPWATGSSIWAIFFPILADVQVCVFCLPGSSLSCNTVGQLVMEIAPCLIMTVHKLLPHSLSLYESQTGER